VKLDITVIVAVYNSEQYLVECLACLQPETRLRVEIIAVDDASTDGSLEILERHRACDTRLRILRLTENGGVSRARNRALSQARGEFVYFVDADDTLDFAGVEELHDMATRERLDLAVGYRHNRSEATGQRTYHATRIRETPVMSGRQFFALSVRDRNQGMGIWQNLYRTDLFRDPDLRFVSDVVYEDLEFFPRAFLAANRAKFRYLPFYCHLMRRGAVSYSASGERSARGRAAILARHRLLLAQQSDDRTFCRSLRVLIAFNLRCFLRDVARVPDRAKWRDLLALVPSRAYLDALATPRRRDRLTAALALMSPGLTCSLMRARAQVPIGIDADRAACR
jgi:glycosyltransferase involved in cell wall biosynthesis